MLPISVLGFPFHRSMQTRFHSLGDFDKTSTLPGILRILGLSRVIHFTSEREFVQLLRQGYPVVVAFTIRGNYTEHLDQVLEVAAAEFYPHVKFLRVECPKYPGFCITRQRREYPFIGIFHSPEQAANRGRVADPNITKYSVKAIPKYMQG
uniref:Thioredoxin domain-containing protein n=1 Tax=Salix viminalis TaxID=40686 RepID=A0A6N2KYF0_SALVM